jgi:hypothetical protein
VIVSSFPLFVALRSNYSRYSNKLSPGWLFGDRKIDKSDAQYSGFRDNVPLLVAVMISTTVISKVLTRNSTSSTPGSLTPRIYLSLAVSLVFIFVLHGFGAIKLISLITIGYLLAGLGGQTAYFGIWVYGIGLLFLNNYFDGSIHPHLLF